MAEVTELVCRARAGDAGANERLFAAVYADLRKLAAQLLRGADGATSLVHEAYFRLARPQALAVNDRQHFFAVAARAMRQLSIDHARARAAQRRGGGVAPVDLDDVIVESDARAEELLALDHALERLAMLDPALVELVEMRFFGGLDLVEIASMSGRSERTLKRDWRKARAFLHHHLGDGGPDDLDA
jgi:RNA polymerase sigma factor (TIGR02999 family)